METALKKIRKEKGLTQVEVAEKAGITERSYQRIENGTQEPKVMTAQLIAQALNIENINDIFPMTQKQKPDGNPAEEPLQQNNSTKKEDIQEF